MGSFFLDRGSVGLLFGSLHHIMSSSGSSYDDYATAKKGAGTSTGTALFILSSSDSSDDDSVGVKNGLTPPLKSTGLEADTEDEKEDNNGDVFFCGNKEQYEATYPHDDGKMTRSETDTIAPNVRERKWNDNYHAAVATYKVNSFTDLTSGSQQYSWLHQAKKQVNMLQTFLEGGGCPKDFEHGSSCWTAERIDMVRPLVEAAFPDKKRKKRHTVTPRRTLPPGGLGTASHHPTSSATRPTLSYIQNSDTGVSNSFDFSIKRSSLTACNKQENQKLYSALVTAANSRFSVAKEQNNKGHYQTGKNWTFLATLICSQNNIIDSTAAAQEMIGVPKSGKLKDALDNYFFDGVFPSNL